MMLLSVPFLEMRWAVSQPAEEKVSPSHVKGNMSAQTLRYRSSRLLRYRVTMLSHPCIEECHFRYMAGAVKSFPSKV